jgi:hypothetical protein
MAANQAKPRGPELSPTPEEVTGTGVDDKVRVNVPRNRSGLNLHDRLLGCGNFTALWDAQARMGRRPSTSSLGTDGSIREHGDEGGGYFNLKRVYSLRVTS